MLKKEIVNTNGRGTRALTDAPRESAPLTKYLTHEKNWYALKSFRAGALKRRRLRKGFILNLFV